MLTFAWVTTYETARLRLYTASAAASRQAKPSPPQPASKKTDVGVFARASDKPMVKTIWGNRTGNLL